MSNRLAFFACLAALAWSCGGVSPDAAEPGAVAAEPEASGDELEARSIAVDEIELTTALDDEGTGVGDPPGGEFLPETKKIYLVATLTGLPLNAAIEVRWLALAGGDPLSVFNCTGTVKHSLTSRLDAPPGGFRDGRYRAQLLVNGREVGEAPFLIADQRTGGRIRVKDLFVAPAVEVGTSKAINHKQSFPKGTKKLFASFFVGGVPSGGSVRVLWYRDDRLIDEHDMESVGERRYTTYLARKGKGLASGDYAVEVEANGEMFSRRTFFVGASPITPAIQDAKVGSRAGKNQIPKRSEAAFDGSVSAIYLGARLVRLPDNAKVEVRWYAIGEERLELKHTSTRIVEKGGKAAVGLGWETGGELAPGPYKAAIVLNGVKMEEVGFTIR